MTASNMKRVTATEAAREFSDLLNRVYYAGERLVVVRNGREVAQIGPVESSQPTTFRELLHVMDRLGWPDEDLAADVTTAREELLPVPDDPRDSSSTPTS